MAAGIPVVASDFPQVRDVVEGSGAGVVADTTKPAAIAAAIERVLADPEMMRRMGERGRAAVSERYHWGASAQRLLEVYAVL
jgi:glycosyltransferase involved in cell wall biosynthesis